MISWWVQHLWSNEWAWLKLELTLRDKLWFILNLVFLAQFAISSLATRFPPKRTYLFWDIFDRFRAVAIFISLVGLIWSATGQKWVLVANYAFSTLLLVFSNGFRTRQKLSYISIDLGLLGLVILQAVYLYINTKL